MQELLKKKKRALRSNRAILSRKKWIFKKFIWIIRTFNGGYAGTYFIKKRKPKKGIITQSLYFRTLGMPCLNYYHDLFYKNKIKVITRNLEELLTARGLGLLLVFQ